MRAFKTNWDYVRKVAEEENVVLRADTETTACEKIAKFLKTAEIPNIKPAAKAANVAEKKSLFKK